MNKYEALLALNTRGKEETVKETIERLEKLFQGEGARIEQVQRLEKRELAYETEHTKSAYFVNIVFGAAPAALDKIRAKLKLENEVLIQNFLKLPATKAPAAAAA
ncbi:MAG: 30S ribosomal protein S6 [Terrimicrobiaceae bacterium]|jgi:small subunit ribosomal protein S6